MRPHSSSGYGSGGHGSHGSHGSGGWSSCSPPPSAPMSPCGSPSPAVINVQQYYLYPGYQAYNMNPPPASATSRNRGSNTLAIDNKIGEAMDLVKSHLMITVRAEVAVLKEQIKELKEKNSKLEYENSILKAAASQETLAKLSQP